MKEESRNRDPKTLRDKKLIRRSPSPRGTRESRKKLSSRHEDERFQFLYVLTKKFYSTKRDVGSRSTHNQRGQDKVIRDDSARKRQDDRRKRSRSPQGTSKHPGRRRADDSERSRVVFHIYGR